MGLLGGYIDVGFVRGGVVVSWQRRPEVLHGTLCLSVNCQACGWDRQIDRQTDGQTDGRIALQFVVIAAAQSVKRSRRAIDR